jgi:hypothetical protein
MSGRRQAPAAISITRIEPIDHRVAEVHAEVDPQQETEK